MSARARSPGASPGAFDPAAAPLQGLDLIEANAGTGKTWTITALYVRLLLEGGCTAESILVVTFTEAATGELRDRIRRRLAETRDAFETGRAKEDDDFTRALLGRVADPAAARDRLATALQDFDQAPVYTIHGFCQRVLGDSAFDAGMPFRTEIVPDQSALVREIVEDFWRREIHTATPLYARYLAMRGLNPARLMADHRKEQGWWELERYLGKPYIDIRKPAAPDDLAQLEAAFERACGAARRIWMEQNAAIRSALVGNTSLSGSTYKAASIPGWLDEMHACLAPESPQLELCDKFEKFTPESLRKGTRSGGTTPTHVFFEACAALKATHGALVEAYERSVVLMKVRLIEYCNGELTARKERRQLQSYDDLLLNLQKALKGERGSELAARLRERYRAALIDEFQDTDPIQYDIFHRIYGDAAEQPVFLVGDPKQSIYSFRGADVYAYIAARDDARHAHTLAVNWRSAPPLLSAVNALFQNAPNPFVIEEIGFTPSEAAQGNRGRFVMDGETVVPFELWLLEGENGKAVTKTAAGGAACRATAAEIARLLNLGAGGSARIEDDRESRGLRGGDIAVLVRSHRQGTEMRAALAALGVASVQRGSASVFASREAEELERVLAAIAEPGREPLIGAALATEMMGGTGEALHALQRDERAWDEMTETFREAHRAWHEAGFVRMLRGFLQRHAVLPRLLEYRDGERRATNLLHLSELLHCDAERQGIGGLLAWFAAKRQDPKESNEAELLRLESDENLVKILTVHAAKGLEFPLVFCSFMWDGNVRSAKDGVIRFHDEEKPVVDFGSKTLEAFRGQAMREERAESLRLLYVALTRAKYRCWMVWGNIRDAETSAPAWLLHRRADASGLAKAFGDDMVRWTKDSMRADLARIAAESKGCIRVSALPVPQGVRFEAAAAAGPELAARAFDGTLRDTRWVTSFTALAHGRSIEAPDYDASDREPQAESVSGRDRREVPPHDGGRDMFAFPRGAQAGKCLHAIFEGVDFAKLERPELERVVTKGLAQHGFDPVWLRAVADMVEAVVETPLDTEGMRLAAVPRERRLDELEFYYPIAALSDTGLRRVLRQAGFPDEIRGRIEELSFAPAQGYMRGFIDLVFEHEGRYYLADYKSNWLGAAPAAYGQSELARAMGREAYYLQYLVYCVALHRYLGARVRRYTYESHFGGVRYLFVRGMQPATGASLGVYADRPAASLIDALDAYLYSRGTP